MPTIQLEIKIKSDIETCFNLSRSIDLHQISTSSTKEKAVAGKIKGLINLNEFVTWEAIHFGVKQRLTSKITAFNAPFHFRDEQQKGAFKFIVHDHYFESKEDYVIMKDNFIFQSPFGVLGRLVDHYILTDYLTAFLVKRNEVIKDFAETEKWKQVLTKV
jgi:ligand-binding SRPBCC domain-containing protein